jgi:putative tryptophan/tyrosine transport system substrate-binding protein
MRRRDFIRAIAGSATAWPLSARAQQAQSMRQIGIITGFAERDEEAQRRIAALLKGLQSLGWSDGDNLRIDYRWGANDSDLIRTNVRELVDQKPDVILVNSGIVLRPLLQQTQTIPVVFVQINDPVGAGFVSNLAHPGGNVTGFTPAEFSLGGKLLETLRDAFPDITRVVVVSGRATSATSGMQDSIEAAAASLGIKVTVSDAQNEPEIERSIQTFAQEQHGGAIVLANPMTNLYRFQIIAQATKNHLPAIYPYRFYVAEGGLMSVVLAQMSGWNARSPVHSARRTLSP